MKVGVPKEVKDHEYRVGLTPGAVREYVRAGHAVVVQRDAGLALARQTTPTAMPVQQWLTPQRRCSPPPGTVRLTQLRPFRFPYLSRDVVTGNFMPTQPAFLRCDFWEE